MSTRQSIFYIPPPIDEHWYTDCFEYDEGEQRVFLEFDLSSIAEIRISGSGGICLDLYGNSEIARKIRNADFRGRGTELLDVCEREKIAEKSKTHIIGCPHYKPSSPVYTECGHCGIVIKGEE